MKIGRKPALHFSINSVFSVLAMKATRVIGSCWCIKPVIHTMPIWLYKPASAQLHHANHGINTMLSGHTNKRPVNIYRPLLTYTRRLFFMVFALVFWRGLFLWLRQRAQIGHWNMGSLSGKAEAPMRRKMMLVLPRKLRSFGFSLK